MDSSDQRKGRNRRRKERRRLILGGWPSERIGLQISRRQFVRSRFLIRCKNGVWSEAHQRLIKMTRQGYWILYRMEVEKLKACYIKLMRERGMARWPEYRDGDRKEVRSLMGKVKEEYRRRMPEHQRQKFIANLREKRRLKEERKRQLAAAAAEKRPASSGPRARPADQVGKRRVPQPSSSSAAGTAAARALHSFVHTCCGIRGAVRFGHTSFCLL